MQNEKSGKSLFLQSAAKQEKKKHEKSVIFFEACFELKTCQNVKLEKFDFIAGTAALQPQISANFPFKPICQKRCHQLSNTSFQSPLKTVFFENYSI